MFPPRKFLFFLFTAIISGVFGQRTVLHLSVDKVCRSGPDPWTCKSRNNCTTLRQAVEKGIRPDVCTFVGNEAIFCCPPEKYFSSTESNSGSQSAQEPSGMQVEEKKKKTKRSSETPSEPKAKRMCEEYSKYVYRNVTLPSMLQGQKPRNVSLYDCGIVPIVGSADAKPKEFPHMALVGYEENQQKQIRWICGGSLISPKFILTAAFCISTDRYQYWVRLGDLDTSSEKEDSDPVNIRVAKKIIHPEYNEKLFYHNIALLELESEAKLNAYVRPICLHTSWKIENDKYIASGWGASTWGGRQNSKLQKLTLPHVANNKCNNSYGQVHAQVIPKGIVEDWMLCAGGEEGKDTCQGYGGGPLQIYANISCMYSIIGIISYGKGCGFGYPSINTRVSHYVPWIEKIVWP